MTTWTGMDRKKTPIADDAGEAFFQQNGRLVVNRELQRRNGMAATTFAQQASPILAIVNGGPGGGTPGPWTVIQPSNGSLVGFQSPTMRWTEGGMIPPQFVAPTNPYSLSFNPTSITSLGAGLKTTSVATLVDPLLAYPPANFDWIYTLINDPNNVFSGSSTSPAGFASTNLTVQNYTFISLGGGTLTFKLTCTLNSEPGFPTVSATWSCVT